MLAILWFVIVFAIVLWLWPIFWASNVRYKVECLVDFPRHECDIGEAIPMTVTLVNRSMLPIPFAEVFVDLPEELSIRADKAVHKLSFTTYLLMRRRVQIAFTLYGYGRGPTSVRQAVVHMHEGLGIQSVYTRNEPSANIGVRPDGIPSRVTPTPVTIQGDTLKDSWLFKDETMFKGVRPYQHGDSARHIHWHATARLGKTVSKEFFSSTASEVFFVLNAQTTDPYWAGTVRPLFEALCGRVTEAATQYEKAHVGITFATNAVITNGRGNTHLYGKMSQAAIRSLLAHAHIHPGASLTVVLQQMLHHRHSLPALIVLFSAFETDEQKQLIQRLKRYGKEVNLVRPDLTADESHDIGNKREDASEVQI